jgi:hypothetical protein
VSLLKAVKDNPSYATKAKHEIEGVAFTSGYLKSPTGIMGMSLFSKLYDHKITTGALQLMLFEDKKKILNDIVDSKRLTRDEKYVLYEIVNRFDIYNLRSQLANAKERRKDHIIFDRGYEREDYPMIDDVDFNKMLELRKRKLTKSKSKRKSCSCKKRK